MKTINNNIMEQQKQQAVSLEKALEIRGKEYWLRRIARNSFNFIASLLEVSGVIDFNDLDKVADYVQDVKVSNSTALQLRDGVLWLEWDYEIVEGGIHFIYTFEGIEWISDVEFLYTYPYNEEELKELIDRMEWKQRDLKKSLEMGIMPGFYPEGIDMVFRSLTFYGYDKFHVSATDTSLSNLINMMLVHEGEYEEIKITKGLTKNPSLLLSDGVRESLLMFTLDAINTYNFFIKRRLL